MYFYICLIITLNILFAHGKKDLKKKEKREMHSIHGYTHFPNINYMYCKNVLGTSDKEINNHKV